MITISIVNHKGGVGKTATALAVAEGLNRRGKETLLIDLDPQCNASYSLNWNVAQTASTPAAPVERDGVAVNTASLFTASPITLNALVKIQSLYVIPAVQSLAIVEKTLTNYNTLTAHLNALAPSLDFCIIDTPPALNNLTLNALIASDYALIPARADVYSLEGIKQLKDTLDAVKQDNSRLEVLGILFNFYERRLRLSRLIEKSFDTVAASLNTSVFTTRIRKAQSVAECAILKTSIYEHASPRGIVSDYEALILEILERTKDND